jgi:hypothetical protein
MPITIRRLPKVEDDPVTGAVRKRVALLMSERGELLARLNEIESELSDARATVRFLNVPIEIPGDADQPRFEFVGEPASSASPTQSEQSVRDIVLGLLQAAGPVGARAAELRKLVEAELGRKLHYKTIGMTLYRLSERGWARRSGLTWFYVPEGAEKEKPGGGPAGALESAEDDSEKGE